MEVDLVEYVRRRLGAPANSLITDPGLWGSIEEKHRCAVSYELYGPSGTTWVAFGLTGLLGYSERGRPAAISTLVRVGWELVEQGLELVIVSFDGLRWCCSKDLPLTQTRLEETLSLMSTQVSFNVNGGVPIELYIDRDPPRAVWFNATVKPAARMSYLAELSRNLSGVLGCVVQLGGRQALPVASKLVRANPVVVSTKTFSKWGCSALRLKRFEALLKKLELYTFLSHESSPGIIDRMEWLTFKIAIAGTEYKFPLYSRLHLSVESLMELEETLFSLLSGTARSVYLSIDYALSREVQLDLE